MLSTLELVVSSCLAPAACSKLLLLLLKAFFA